MRLEIGKFKVRDIVFGGKTAYCGGVLSVNKEDALKVVYEDKNITEADLKIVHPGDMVRLCPVKDSVEFRCKVNGGEGAYPGGHRQQPMPAIAHRKKNNRLNVRFRRLFCHFLETAEKSLATRKQVI